MLVLHVSDDICPCWDLIARLHGLELGFREHRRKLERINEHERERKKSIFEKHKLILYRHPNQDLSLQCYHSYNVTKCNEVPSFFLVLCIISNLVFLAEWHSPSKWQYKKLEKKAITKKKVVFERKKKSM